MKHIAFGLFDHLEQRPGEPARDTYAGRIKLVQAAERAGFHAYHVAEHHFTPLGLAPSPGLFLAALSQVTTTIRLGSLVHLLPLYEPVRLVEEICMLDHLSGGRLDLGVGRGVSPFELGHYGVDFLDSKELFDNAMDALTAGLTQPQLHHQSQRARYRGAPMVLQPLQRPLPPLWYGITSEANVAFAAERGMHVVGLAPTQHLSGLMRRYAELREAGRGGVRDLSAPGSVSRRGALRQIYVGASDADAERTAARAYPMFYNNLMQLWRTFNVVNTLIPPTYTLARDLGILVTGGPGRVHEQLAEFFADGACNYLALEFSFGDLSDAEALASLQRFAGEVMPALARLASGE
ncbi:MAG: LLM class flavin-dependent oxidoreductase [Immundisolibacter sp.]|uniref:LLM class flavin-dependent oxidoreductase n=1 Tax=Immundisolibacter sp. TaxID=1934948 RepID=UPI003EDFDD6C